MTAVSPSATSTSLSTLCFGNDGAESPLELHVGVLDVDLHLDLAVVRDLRRDT